MNRYTAELRRQAAACGIDVSAAQGERLLTHLWLVLNANQHVNLTAITDPRKAIVKHIVDSLFFLRSYREGEGFYLDMGTGAGYPGLVLEIMDQRPGVLLDAREKKCDICTSFCRELEISEVTCCADRIEDHARTHRENYGTITARALAPLGVLLEYVQPLLMPGGRLIAGKGTVDDNEWIHGLEVAELLGLTDVSRETFRLPYDMGHREILVYQKVGESSIALPRKTGMATKRPL